MTKKDILILSTADWDNPFWTNKQHVAVELAKDHYFDIEVANRDLGYKAAFDMETALKATIEDLKARGF